MIIREAYIWLEKLGAQGVVILIDIGTGSADREAPGG